MFCLLKHLCCYVDFELPNIEMYMIVYDIYINVYISVTLRFSYSFLEFGDWVLANIVLGKLIFDSLTECTKISKQRNALICPIIQYFLYLCSYLCSPYDRLFKYPIRNSIHFRWFLPADIRIFASCVDWSWKQLNMRNSPITWFFNPLFCIWIKDWALHQTPRFYNSRFGIMRWLSQHSVLNRLWVRYVM